MKLLAITVVLAALCAGCAPTTQQALAEAVGDARAAYTCIEIADECSRKAEAAGDNAPLLLEVMRGCLAELNQAHCKETLDKLAKYLPPASPPEVESLKLDNDWKKKLE